MMMSHYYTSLLLRSGGYHLRSLQNGQDHATTRQTDQATVLCVADGVSGGRGILAGRRSRTEVGAFLCAEVAASAAASALKNGDDIATRVSEALAEFVGPLARAIGSSIKSALPSTLVLYAPTAPIALWVATDGLEDEPSVREQLRGPIRNIARIHEALEYPAPGGGIDEAETCRKALRLALDADRHDDLGIAFTAIRSPRLIADVLKEAA